MYIYKKSLKILALNKKSSIFKDKIKWRQRDSNPRSLRCERSAFPAKLCPHNDIRHSLISYIQFSIHHN